MVQPRQMGSQILHKARGMLSKFQLAHHRPLQHKDAMDSRWVPPSPPWYKINVDAAIFNQLNSVGVGALIRDHEGSVLAAMSMLRIAPEETETSPTASFSNGYLED